MSSLRLVAPWMCYEFGDGKLYVHSSLWRRSRHIYLRTKRNQFSTKSGTNVWLCWLYRFVSLAMRTSDHCSYCRQLKNSTVPETNKLRSLFLVDDDVQLSALGTHFATTSCVSCRTCTRRRNHRTYCVMCANVPHRKQVFNKTLIYYSRTRNASFYRWRMKLKNFH